MGYPLRMFEAGGVYELTMRTLRSELKLRPSKAVNTIILGAVGRGLHLHKSVRLHYFVALSNHIHMMLSADDGESLSAFVRDVKSIIAKRIGGLLGDEGTLWDGRATWIRIVDASAMIGRLKYLLAHGLKEGLVATPEEWPGASAYAAFVGDMAMPAEWHDVNGENQARRLKRRPVDVSRFRIPYGIKLTPIPPFAGLDPAALRARHLELVQQVVAEENARHVQLGRVLLGVAAVLAMDPHARPRRTKRSRARLCHAVSQAAREAYHAAYRAFVAAYAAASKAFRNGERAVFPPGSFPCRGRWVTLAPAPQPAVT